MKYTAASKIQVSGDYSGVRKCALISTNCNKEERKGARRMDNNQVENEKTKQIDE